MALEMVGGHPTWVRLPRSEKPVVTLLHGGLSSSASMLRRFNGRLSREFALAAFDRRGHGRTPDRPGEDFHYEEMADETIAFLELLGRRSHLVGHSDGGVVALLVARRRPELVDRVVAVGANFHFAGVVPIPALEPDGPEFDEWAAEYVLNAPHDAAHASEVWIKSLRLFATEPTLDASDLSQIRVPVLVMAGDDDSISLDHTVQLYEALPEGQLAILPASTHAVLKEHPGLSTLIIRGFLTGDVPPPTLYPIRRAPGNTRAR